MFPSLKPADPEIIGRRVIFTLRKQDHEVLARSAARSGCSVTIWLRGLVEARIADERALERDLERSANALDFQHAYERAKS